MIIFFLAHIHQYECVQYISGRFSVASRQFVSLVFMSHYEYEMVMRKKTETSTAYVFRQPTNFPFSRETKNEIQQQEQGKKI